MNDPNAERSGPPRTSPIEGTELLDRYLDRVFRFLRGMTGDEDMASDLTQETMLRLLEAQPEPGNLEAYVFATARNVFRSRRRRGRLEDRHTPSVSPDALGPVGDPRRHEEPDRAAERAELRGALAEAVRALPEELRAVFLLSEIDGLSYGEIATVLGCPAGTVGSRKHHAMARLRTHLRRLGHGL